MKKEVVSYREGSPYAAVIKANGFLFVSGHVSMDMATGEIVTGEIRTQTRQVCENLKAAVEAAGSSLDDTVRATVYITDMADFAAMNEVFREYFPQHPPTRSTVVVSLVRPEFIVEIDLIVAM
jgi:2-iminobutanoate/2-iminopropanoate deaminase